MRLHLPILAAFMALAVSCSCPDTDESVRNPVLPGFNPDPSLCRVGDDYYLTCSSFAWYPGMPVYHSRDLVHWELISHALDRPDMVDLNGIDDNNGIWASTIRYHEGMFYIVSNAHKCGENFLIKAKDPRGPWSDPVWIKDANGIDGSLMWEDDGKCYYVGNNWDFQRQWTNQCSIWVAEIDTGTGELGPKTHLTYGVTTNAACTEAPHIYKVDGKYILLLAEGGSGYNHSVTIHCSDSLRGPYTPSQINPVLTNRHLGPDYPVQAAGHADIVQTQNGEWWGVCLATRQIDGFEPIGRETFLLPVQMWDGVPLFNPGVGAATMQVRRPDLPEWLPEQKPARCEFLGDEPDLMWHCTRIPHKKFFSQEDGVMKLFLLPETASERTSCSMLIRRVEQHYFDASCKMTFHASSANEEAGILLHRTSNSYYALLKGADSIKLVRRYLESEEVVAAAPYQGNEIFLKIEGRGKDLHFLYGEKERRMKEICPAQSVDVVHSDGDINKFNGTGVGMYATANGQASDSFAAFEWFEYKNLDR